MTKDILEYLNEKDKLAITDDLAKYILKFKDNKNKPDDKKFGKIDFQFDLSSGVMKGSGANTFLAFDVEKDGILYEFIKANYERELNPEEVDKLAAFVQGICKDLTNAYSVSLQETIRGCVIPDSKEWIIPLDQIDILSIEIVDYSSIDEDSKYTFKISEIPGYHINMNAIFTKIMEIKDKNPDKTNAQIVQEQKEAGDPLFDGVESVLRGDKFLWDISIAMYVDYSLSNAFLAQQSVPER